jgi:hypothetical protein
MKSMLREGENMYHSHMHNVPKYIKLININHTMSLLQMQGCPQSNIKQEIKSFCFKNFTKSYNELSENKQTQTKIFLLKRTIQKKSNLSLNNSKEKTMLCN